MIKGVSHIAFLVSDMQRSLHFYCEILKLRKAFEISDDTGNPWLIYIKICDGQFIELFYGGAQRSEDEVSAAARTFRATRRTPGVIPSDTNPSGYLHLCLEVDDIHEIAGRLSENGITLDIEPKLGKDCNYQCWASDPDGNRIEFMQIDPRSPQRNC